MNHKSVIKDMGGTSSKVSVANTTKVLTDFLINTAKECSTGGANDIVFEFRDVVGDVVIEDIDIRQRVSLNFDCIQQTYSQAQLENKLAQFLQQQSKATGNVLGFLNKVDSSVRTEIITEIVGSVNMSDLQRCAANASNTFRLAVENVGGRLTVRNITVDQMLQIISQCNQMSQMAANMANTINTIIDQRGEAEKGGILQGIFGDFAKFIPYILGAILVGGLIFAVLVFMMQRQKGDMGDGGEFEELGGGGGGEF